jgi:hypothetical protein
LVRLRGSRQKNASKPEAQAEGNRVFEPETAFLRLTFRAFRKASRRKTGKVFSTGRTALTDTQFWWLSLWLLLVASGVPPMTGSMAEPAEGYPESHETPFHLPARRCGVGNGQRLLNHRPALPAQR